MNEKITSFVSIRADSIPAQSSLIKSYLIQLEGAPIAHLGDRQTLDRNFCGFDPHLGLGVVSLSKTFHPSCLVLVRPREPPQKDRKIVDRDLKPQTKQNKNNPVAVVLIQFSLIPV